MNDIKITQKPIADLIPYSRNPRRNDEAVPMVMNSIKDGMPEDFFYSD